MARGKDSDKTIDTGEYRTSDLVQTETLLKLLDEKEALARKLLEQIKSIHAALVNQNKESE